jgi:hypothetical protein
MIVSYHYDYLSFERDEGQGNGRHKTLVYTQKGGLRWVVSSIDWTEKMFSVVTIRPPTTCRFYRRASRSISSSPTLVLAHPANAPYLAAYYRPLPRRLFSPSSAPPAAPPGPAFLAFPGGPPVSPRPGRTWTIGLHRAVERAWALMTTPW